MAFQICMSIASFTAMKTKHNVLYIDTGGSFSAARIKEMLQRWTSSLDDQVYLIIYDNSSAIASLELNFTKKWRVEWAFRTTSHVTVGLRDHLTLFMRTGGPPIAMPCWQCWWLIIHLEFYHLTEKMFCCCWWLVGWISLLGVSFWIVESPHQ